MTRQEFRRKFRAHYGTPREMVLRSGKRLKLGPLQTCAAGWKLLISLDGKKLLEFEYDEILDLRPLVAAKRRRKAN